MMIRMQRHNKSSIWQY